MEYQEPIMTLTPNLEPTPTAQNPTPESGPELCKLSPDEQKVVADFAEKIDITDSAQVLQFGAAAQKNIADFSDSALQSVRTKDMGEVGEMVTQLVMELKGFDAQEEQKGLRGLFHKTANRMELTRVRYEKAEENVEKISEKLQGHQLVLLKDIQVLDQMYEKNLAYYKQLTMYILAGQQALTQARDVTLAKLREKAAHSSLPDDAQKANDFSNQCERFEKKLHDLELTRVVCLQMAPQIRMIQNNDSLMTEKIQTSLVSTIPLWKSQMVLALGLHDSQRALEAQRQVTDMTNALLKKNADMLKQATVETAKESERGIVDLETLQHTNAQLISSLDEVLQIQTEGAQKRKAAEAELRRIEGELKQKLLEARR